MRVFVVTPPDPVVTLEEAKTHLKVEHDDEDTLIAGMVAAATAHIDGPEGWLGRCIGMQTLEARFDRFDEATLPYPPLVAVDEVRYLTDADEQVASSSTYETIGAQVVPVNGASWPTPLSRPEAVRVRYQVGYETVPAPIRAAILLMTDDLYRNRGEAVIGATTAKVEMSPTVAALLSPYRVWRW